MNSEGKKVWVLPVIRDNNDISALKEFCKTENQVVIILGIQAVALLTNLLQVPEINSPNTFLLWHHDVNYLPESPAKEIQILTGSGQISIAGLNVGYVTGMEDPWSLHILNQRNPKNEHTPFRKILGLDVKRLERMTLPDCDLFLSLEAPLNILSYCRKEVLEVLNFPAGLLDEFSISMIGAWAIAKLVNARKPRIAISQFWKSAGIMVPPVQIEANFFRPPFKFKSKNQQTCQFVSLSSLYQSNSFVNVNDLLARKFDTENSPTFDPISSFLGNHRETDSVTKRPRAAIGNAPPKGYICKICKESDHYISDCPQKNDPKRHQKPEKPEISCWFCLANPNTDTSLVLDIGNIFYLTLTKGPLTDFHFLVIPVQHCPSTLEYPQDWRDEIKSFHAKMLAVYLACTGTNGQIIQSECITRSYDKFHMNILCLVIPETHQAMEIIKTESCQNYHFIEAPDTANIPNNVEGVFKVSKISIASNESSMYLYCPRGKYMDLLMIRKILCRQVLGLPSKENWRNCVEEKSVTDDRVKRFREVLSSQ